MAYVIQGTTKEGYEVFVGKKGSKTVFWSTTNTTFDLVTKYQHFTNAFKRAEQCIKRYGFKGVSIMWLNPDGTTRKALKASCYAPGNN